VSSSSSFFSVHVGHFCSDGGRGGWHLRMGSVSWFGDVAFDYVIYFGDHEDANHFVLPSLEVAPSEARDVGDVDGGGFVGRRHCWWGWLISEKKRTWVCQQTGMI